MEVFEGDPKTLVFAIHLLSHLALENFDKTIKKFEKWANNDDWEIRENSIYPLISGLKKDRKKAFNLLKEWAKSKIKRDPF